jgi:hypothetical protein
MSIAAGRIILMPDSHCQGFRFLIYINYLIQSNQFELQFDVRFILELRCRVLYAYP